MSYIDTLLNIQKESYMGCKKLLELSNDLLERDKKDNEIMKMNNTHITNNIEVILRLISENINYIIIEEMKSGKELDCLELEYEDDDLY